MSLFMTAVPLFTADLAVDAYWMRYQDGKKLLGLKDDFTALSGITISPGIDIVNQMGIEPFTGGKPLLIDVNKFQVLGGTPKTIECDPKLVYFIIHSDAIDDIDCLDKCKELKDLGYGLAIRNYFRAKNANNAKLFLELCDYCMLNTTRVAYRDAMMKALSGNRTQKFILTDILNNDEYKQLKSMRNALYEGRFYSQPITAGETEISALKLNALQLLRLMGQDDYDLNEASSIIQHDPAISIALLRFINSSGVGLTQKVTSIKNAVNLLGQKETKKWVFAAVSIQLSADRPNELTKLSLLRAKFAENLAPLFKMPSDSQSLFMMGLLSLLDVILERSMEDAVNELALDKNVRDALVAHTGKYADVLHLIFNYERAEWENVSLVMIRHELEADQIGKAFMDALAWYRDMLELQNQI